MRISDWSSDVCSSDLRAFCREYLDRIPGMRSDAFGNRMITIGGRPRTLWSCHVDTVAAVGGAQAVGIDAHGVAHLCDGKAGMSLGADDGAGLWLMLGMIAAACPGLYLFHRGEEQGCLGSRWTERHTHDRLANTDPATTFTPPRPGAL